MAVFLKLEKYLGGGLGWELIHRKTNAPHIYLLSFTPCKCYYPFQSPNKAAKRLSY
jgi:hypothetical protein